jgi:hypothetical protein
MAMSLSPEKRRKTKTIGVRNNVNKNSMGDIKKNDKKRLNRGVSIPMPEGPYSSQQGEGPGPSQGSELKMLAQELK